MTVQPKEWKSGRQPRMDERDGRSRREPNWVTLASNLVAVGTNLIFTTNAAEAAEFYRVFRLP